MSDFYVHPNADVHLTARIGKGCWIGPNVIIGANARIGAYSVIGSVPEHRDYWDANPFELFGVVVGARAKISEFVSVHAGTKKPTAIGEEAQVHNHSHVAHDCDLFHGALLGGHSSLAGHVVLMDGATVAGGSFVHQWAVVGPYAFVGARSFLKAHVPPGEKWAGSPARPAGFNEVRLAREEFSLQELLWARGGDFKRLTSGRDI